MKRLLIILFCLLSINAFADVYYISTTGNDSNPGTISSPWLTWGKITGSVSAGDTIYIRGGTYHSEYTGASAYHVRWNTVSGTVSDTIKIWAYPGESPVLDLSTTPVTNNYAYGLYIRDCDYLWIKGLRVTNLTQTATAINGLSVIYTSVGSTHILYDQCEADNSGGWGFRVSGASSYIHFRNCDAHHLADALTVPYPYGGADGFQIDGASSTSTNIYYDGCRAWCCSDDGWDMYRNDGYVELNNCRSFWNGYSDGGITTYDASTSHGNGIKLGPSKTHTPTTYLRKVTNCVVANNKEYGIEVNVGVSYPYTCAMYIYNNIAYGNTGNVGIMMYMYSIDANHVIRNNIAFNNNHGGTQYTVSPSSTHTNNSWNGVAIVNALDFKSVSALALDDARNADGSLNVMTYLHLTSTSDAIGEGVAIGGLTYDADGIEWENPPSLGAFEYLADDPPVGSIVISTIAPYWSSNTTAISGGNVTDDGGAAVTQRGVCWNTTGTPTVDDYKTTDGTGTGVYSSTLGSLSKANTYYIRAYAVNIAGTSYGEELVFRDSQMLGKSGKALLSKDGKQLIIQ